MAKKYSRCLWDNKDSITNEEVGLELNKKAWSTYFEKEDFAD